MGKTSYKYYLENGACLEYDLFPGSSIVKVIDYLSSDYCSKRTGHHPVLIFIRPEISVELNKYFASTRMMQLSSFNSAKDVGFQLMQIMTVIGPLRVVTLADLEYPIFIGTYKEYETNSFNLAMGKILNE